MKNYLKLVLILILSITLNSIAEDDCVHGDCENGYGIFVGKDYRYEGYFKDGLYNGDGILTYADGGKIQGKFQDNLVHGKAKYYYKGGDLYDGNYEFGLKNGFGKYLYSDGNIYEGLWENNIENGKGKYIYKNGSSREGTFKNGLLDGKATVKEKDGSTFIGIYKNNIRNGFGEYENTSFKLVGNYVNGLLNGLVKIYYKDGRYFEGKFRKNKKNGEGIEKASNGNIVFQGNYVNDIRYGKGKYTLDNGDYYEGEIRYDEITGYGKYQFKSGDYYEGNFQDGKFSGQGTYYFSTGQKQIGIWENGELAKEYKNENEIIKENNSNYDVIDMVKGTNNLFEVETKLNGKITMDFLFDTGASETAISQDLAITLIRTKTVDDSDFLDDQEYILADGSRIKSMRFKLKTLQIGNRVFKDVVVSISNSFNSLLLLGSNVINQFGKYTTDYKAGKLYLHKN